MQRCKCKTCGNNYRVAQESTEERRLGLMMYLEGLLGFHSIGRLLGFSHVAVIQGIKKYGSQLEGIKNETSVSIMEMDEMAHLYRVKKTITNKSRNLYYWEL